MSPRRYSTWPPDLLAALESAPNCRADWNLPLSGCKKLRLLSSLGYAKTHTWGFRIYRTTYGKSSSSSSSSLPSENDNDADFERAIEVLHAYMRRELFAYDHGNQASAAIDESIDPVQTNAKRVLWQQLDNEIVQDREQLEGASADEIADLAREWVSSQYEGAEINHNSRHRYHVIVDEEVLRHLLQLPMPAVRVLDGSSSEAATFAVKVCDVQVGTHDDDYIMDSEDENPNAADEEGMWEEEDDDGYEGWFWIDANSLVRLWFDDDNADELELCSWVDSCGRERRFVYWWTKMNMGCGHSVAEHRLMFPSIFRKEEEEDGPELLDPPSTAKSSKL